VLGRRRAAGRARPAILTQVDRLTWLSEWSADVVRGLLNRAAPSLGDGPIVLSGSIDTSDPRWSSGSAVVGRQFIAKFAFSAPTAERRWREAQVLQALSGRPGLHLPEVIATCSDPVFFVTRLVEGVPLSYELLNAASRAQVGEIGSELALFLSSLHQPETLACVAAAAGPARPPHPPPQATTDELRTRLTPMLRPDQPDVVRRWCARADDVLACCGEPVFVHGDLHGYNQVWDQRRLRLRLVADFETSGGAEAEYDLRYIPALGPGVDLLISTAEHYGHRTGRSLNLDHVMAWHVRSYLGEALWRSEAGLPLLLPLPGGGTPSDYVDELSERFDALQLAP
jgi:aminoglycoside phosphotransferase (APT) family kinase protein